MDNRAKIQEEVKNLFKPGIPLVLNWATGVGKSYMAITLQESLDNPKTFICVAETSHIENWQNEYIKHGKTHLLDNTTIFCYHSLHKYENSVVDLIILDEAHHFNTELRISYLETITAKYHIFLSATLKFDELNNIRSLYNKRLSIHNVPLSKAVDLDILTEPSIHLIELTLDNSNPTESIHIKRAKPKTCMEITYKQFVSTAYSNNVELIVKCTQLEKYRYLTNIIEENKRNFMRTTQEFMKIRWLKSANDRKKYLASLKTPYLTTITENLSHRKYLCFCDSIEQAEVLSVNVLHSKQPAKEQKRILEAFNSGLINNLFVIGKLKEGQNIENIQSGVITQVDNQTRTLRQKIGRILRNTVDPEVYILFFKNTVDETYIDTALDGMENLTINIIPYEVYNRPRIN